MGVVIMVGLTVDGLLNILLDRSKRSLQSIWTGTCLIFLLWCDAPHHAIAGSPSVFFLLHLFPSLVYPPPHLPWCSSLTLACFPFHPPFLEICILMLTFLPPSPQLCSLLHVSSWRRLLMFQGESERQLAISGDWVGRKN